MAHDGWSFGPRCRVGLVAALGGGPARAAVAYACASLFRHRGHSVWPKDCASWSRITTSLTGGAWGNRADAGGHGTAWLGKQRLLPPFLALAVLCRLSVAWFRAAGSATPTRDQPGRAAAPRPHLQPRAAVAAFALSALTGLVARAVCVSAGHHLPAAPVDVDITVLSFGTVVIGGSGTVLGPLVGRSDSSSCPNTCAATIRRAHNWCSVSWSSRAVCSSRAGSSAPRRTPCAADGSDSRRDQGLPVVTILEVRDLTRRFGALAARVDGVSVSRRAWHGARSVIGRTARGKVDRHRPDHRSPTAARGQSSDRGRRPHRGEALADRARRASPGRFQIVRRFAR